MAWTCYECASAAAAAAAARQMEYLTCEHASAVFSFTMADLKVSQHAAAYYNPADQATPS